MSKRDSKSKLAQQELDLSTLPVQEEHGGMIDFVLKIHDGHLHDLEISSVANLLSALGRIVGVKEATFKTIKEGSTTIALSVPDELKSLAISNITKENTAKQKQILRIQKELNRYGFHNAEISYGFLNDTNVYEATEILYVVPCVEIEETFKQTEFLDGRVTRLQKGKDKTDHISIILNDGNEVSAQCTKSTLKQLLPYFDKDTNLRFEGEATYLSKSSTYQLVLKKFIINKFHVIEDQSLEDWVDDFRAKGASNWLNQDDPISEWLKERQE